MSWCRRLWIRYLEAAVLEAGVVRRYGSGTSLGDGVVRRRQSGTQVPHRGQRCRGLVVCAHRRRSGSDRCSARTRPTGHLQTSSTTTPASVTEWLPSCHETPGEGGPLCLLPIPRTRTAARRETESLSRRSDSQTRDRCLIASTLPPLRLSDESNRTRCAPWG
jgi:hypothetical protein